MKNRLAIKLREKINSLPLPVKEQESKLLQLIDEAGIQSETDLINTAGNTHSDSRLRVASCVLLGRLGNRKAAPTLAQVFRQTSEKEVFWEAAKALVILKAENLHEVLVPVLSSGDVEKTCAAAWMVGMTHAKEAIPQLKDIVSDETLDVNVRSHAMEALALLGAKETVPGIIDLLKNDSAEIRFWAAYALGQLGDPRALPSLKMLINDVGISARGHGSVGEEAKNAIENIQG